MGYEDALFRGLKGEMAERMNRKLLYDSSGLEQGEKLVVVSANRPKEETKSNACSNWSVHTK